MPRPGFVPPATAVPSCPAAAAPLRRPAVGLLAGLRLAGGYRVGCSTTPEASPLAFSLLLSPCCQRRLLPLAGVRACCPPSAPPAALAAPSATSRLACSRCSIAPRPAASFGASRGFSQRCAVGGLRPTEGPRFRACRRARWPAAPGGQLVGAVPPRLTFGFHYPCPYTFQIALRGFPACWRP